MSARDRRESPILSAGSTSAPTGVYKTFQTASLSSWMNGDTRPLARRPVGSLGFLGQSDLERLSALPDEPDEPLSFGSQGVALLSGQRLEQFDHEHRLPASSLRLPRPPNEAVDEHGGWNHAVLRSDHLAVVVGDDAGAIGVGEDQVIELGQEAWRGRSVRVRARRDREGQQV